jgi:tetratricopeptide (TPR) repeat protein
MDVDEALNQYIHLRDAPEALRQQAINDVEQLTSRYPRAQGVLKQLRGEPAAPEAAAEPAVVAAPAPQPPPVEPQAAEPVEGPAVEAVNAAAVEPAASAATAVVEAQPAPAASAASAEPSADITAAGQPAPVAPKPSAQPAESGAPQPIAAQPAPASAAFHDARLYLARSLRDTDPAGSAEQYKALIRTPLLPQVIEDLSQLLQEQPGERGMRVLLADALTHAGRLQEAIEQYRQLV